MKKPKIDRDIRLMVEGILDSTLRNTDVGFQCPFCGILRKWIDSIEIFPHDKDCAYLEAMRKYHELGMGDE